MALTVTSRYVETGWKNSRMVMASVAFDASYTTGGLAFTPAMFGLSSIVAVFTAENGTEFAAYDRTNAKLKLYTADGVEAVAASNQSAVTIDVLVFGA